jgi:phosphopantothenate-cysteine ligase
MKKLNVMVTSGGTSEKIDDVRKVTNSGTGALGAVIAHLFAQADEVGAVTYVCSEKAVRPSPSKKIRERIADDVLAVKAAVEDELSGEEYHIIVHSMAIGDYMLKAVTEPAPLALAIAGAVAQAGDTSESSIARIAEDQILNPHAIKERKISSDKDSLVFVMVKAPKIISLFRGLAPNALICGFKLLSGVSEKELVRVGQSLLEKNDLDFVLANDMETVRIGKHTGYLIDKQGEFEVAVSKTAIAELIVVATLGLLNEEAL